MSSRYSEISVLCRWSDTLEVGCGLTDVEQIQVHHARGSGIRQIYQTFYIPWAGVPWVGVKDLKLSRLPGLFDTLPVAARPFCLEAENGRDSDDTIDRHTSVLECAMTVTCRGDEPLCWRSATSE